MRMSMIAGLALCAAMAAGHAYAVDSKRADAARKHPNRKEDVVRQEAPTQFRIPAHPLVYDCVHVTFPQCNRGYNGLNDGSFSWR